MAEATTEETTDTSETEEQEQQEQPKREEIPPAVAAALKKANKEAETYRRRLQELEDKDKSETQRATERATQAEKAAADAAASYLRLKVGIAKGLPVGLAERLKGDSEEEMSADADSLLAAMKPNGKAGSFDAGAKKSAPAGDDMNSFLMDAIRNRRT